MRTLTMSLAILLIVVMLPASVFAAILSNVALGKDVTLNGPFFTGGWGGGATVPESSVVDGVFLPRNTQWDQGAVWWDSREQAGSSLQIDLDGVFSISSFVVQADDNDWYKLFYRNGDSDPWHLIWDIPPVYTYGMETRPNPLDNTQTFELAASILATDLMFMGNDGDYLYQMSDWYYSVSEIQAYGTSSVPEPATMILLGSAFAGLAVARRKKN